MALPRSTRDHVFRILVTPVDPDIYGCEIEAVTAEQIPGEVLAQCSTQGEFHVNAIVPGGLRDDQHPYYVCGNCLPHAVRTLETEHAPYAEQL